MNTVARGTQKAHEILDLLVSGTSVTKETLTKMCGNTNFSSQISTVRCNLFVPIECGKNSKGETIWYMTHEEIRRYYSDREFQVAEMQVYVTEKQDSRVVKNLIELYTANSDGKSRVNSIIREALTAIRYHNQSVKVS
jgi:hypothetical protein